MNQSQSNSKVDTCFILSRHSSGSKAPWNVVSRLCWNVVRIVEDFSAVIADLSFERTSVGVLIFRRVQIRVVSSQVFHNCGVEIQEVWKSRHFSVEFCNALGPS